MKAKRTEVGKAIEKLVKAGKPLSGLLVGMASSVGVAAESEVKAPQLAGVPLPPPRIVATNKVSEVHGRMVRGRTKPVVMGKMPVAFVRQDVKSPPVSVELYLVVEGDTLTKIAKRHKTTMDFGLSRGLAIFVLLGVDDLVLFAWIEFAPKEAGTNVGCSIGVQRDIPWQGVDEDGEEIIGHVFMLCGNEFDRLNLSAGRQS